MILKRVYLSVGFASLFSLLLTKAENTGKKQSPIEINNDTFIQLIDGVVQLESYESKVILLSIPDYKNITVTNEKNITISLTTNVETSNEPSAQYVFDHMEFYIGCSEHILDKNSNPLEIHLVHYNSIYDSYEAAKQNINGLLIIAILYQENTKENFAVCHVWEVKHNTQWPLQDLTLSHFLPTDWNHYYAYEGSLTTDDFDEVVQWIIIDEPADITTDQLENLKKEASNQTCRPVQDLNDRVVYKVKVKSKGTIYRSCQILIIISIIFTHYT